jgi:hypothetical protein
MSRIISKVTEQGGLQGNNSASGRSQVRMPAPTPATQAVPFVIISIPSGQMAGHYLKLRDDVFLSHPLKFINPLKTKRICFI